MGLCLAGFVAQTQVPAATLRARMASTEMDRTFQLLRRFLSWRSPIQTHSVTSFSSELEFASRLPRLHLLRLRGCHHCGYRTVQAQCRGAGPGWSWRDASPPPEHGISAASAKLPSWDDRAARRGRT
eukprot:414696-Hanusia_phi.AAC.1